MLWTRFASGFRVSRSQTNGTFHFDLSEIRTYPVHTHCIMYRLMKFIMQPNLTKAAFVKNIKKYFSCRKREILKLFCLANSLFRAKR